MGRPSHRKAGWGPCPLLRPTLTSLDSSLQSLQLCAAKVYLSPVRSLLLPSLPVSLHRFPDNINFSSPPTELLAFISSSLCWLFLIYILDTAHDFIFQAAPLFCCFSFLPHCFHLFLPSAVSPPLPLSAVFSLGFLFFFHFTLINLSPLAVYRFITDWWRFEVLWYYVAIQIFFRITFLGLWMNAKLWEIEISHMSVYEFLFRLWKQILPLLYDICCNSGSACCLPSVLRAETRTGHISTLWQTNWLLTTIY